MNVFHSRSNKTKQESRTMKTGGVDPTEGAATSASHTEGTMDTKMGGGGV